MTLSLFWTKARKKRLREKGREYRLRRGLSFMQREPVSSLTGIAMFLQTEKITLPRHSHYMSIRHRSTQWVVAGIGKSDLGVEKKTAQWVSEFYHTAQLVFYVVQHILSLCKSFLVQLHPTFGALLEHYTRNCAKQ